MAAAAGMIIGGLFLLLRYPLLGVYVSSEEALAAGLLRMSFMLSGYFLYGLIDALVGFQRGLGSSVPPMVISLLGMCALRVAWVFFVFPRYYTPVSLLISYPVSWVLTLAGQAVCAFFVRRRVYAAAERAQA